MNMLQLENYFTSKADVLKFLQSKIKKSSIEKIYDFTVEEWEENKKEIIKNIQTQFTKKKIIVRSSAMGEDSIEKSNAGSYDSILDVQTQSKEKIVKAVNAVIRSYANNMNYNKNNQILIQNQTIYIQTSGVIFTKVPESGAPYFVINFEEGPSTDGVTKGIVNQSVKLFRNSTNSSIPKKWKKLILSIKEIESILHYDSLDIEFGITKSNKITIFQVRPITSIKNSSIENMELKITDMIKQNTKKFSKLNKKNRFGDHTIFSDMSDWNPAEIIGNNPNLLDYSLYDFLIMNKIWHQSRRDIGYQNMGKSPLMVRFGNKPYVDVRASFSSLIPNSIPLKLRKKLMNYYLKKLEKFPFLHDKIEFEILFTCYDFKVNSRMNELKKYGFTKKEIYELKMHMVVFTNKIIEEFPRILRNCEKSIKLLTNNRNLIKSQMKTKSYTNIAQIENIDKLLKDCKKYGTFPFATIARISFISSILLISFPENKEIPKNFHKNFLRSIETPISDIQEDVEFLVKKRITKKQFLKKYGHLRPGTYDITVPRYDNEEKFFENLKYLKKHKSVKLLVNDKSLEKILIKHGLKFQETNFLEFIKESIVQRENLKFEFTKNLSDALELIAQCGENLGFSRHELSYLDINTILKSKNQSDQIIKQKWKNKILKEKKHTKIANLMLLPPILFSERDFHYLEYFVTKPNFITSKQISGSIVNLKNFDEKNLNLENKIVLIEHADPGYDWIFTKKPKGLITKYGGVASHMSIRCYEMGLPAAIGCGEILYQKLLNASKILLDCENRQVITLIDKIADEYMQIKKTLKSLGYTK